MDEKEITKLIKENLPGTWEHYCPDDIVNALEMVQHEMDCPIDFYDWTCNDCRVFIRIFVPDYPLETGCPCDVFGEMDINAIELKNAVVAYIKTYILGYSR